MIKASLNNIDNPLPNETFTAAQAIQAVNRLIWSEEVQDDDMHDTLLIKAFLVGTLPNIPAPVKHSKTIPVMETTIEGAQKRIAKAIEDYANRCKFIGDPRETNPDLEYIGVFLDSVGDEMAAISASCNSLHARYVEALANANQLQADFDTVDAEAANHLAEKIELQKAIDERKDNFETVSTASARRLEEKIELQKEIDELNAELDRRLATAEKLQEERDDLHARWLQACANEETLRQANINLIHAAHDNT